MKIIQTEDNSHSLFSEQYKENYHSIFGAIAESQHIFIEAGFNEIKKKDICIFEMGLGTGLNAFLTMQHATKYNKQIYYIGIEKHPVPANVYSQMNYAQVLSLEESYFQKIHTSPWEQETPITANFILHKTAQDIQRFSHQQQYDLVYFDAFSPDIQPELWTKNIFEPIFNHMNKGALLLTYSVKGIVKRALKEVGFVIEKIPGPKGKREILRAYKK